jgi:hypothetical protein
LLKERISRLSSYINCYVICFAIDVVSGDCHDAIKINHCDNDAIVISETEKDCLKGIAMVRRASYLADALKSCQNGIP